MIYAFKVMWRSHWKMNLMRVTRFHLGQPSGSIAVSTVSENCRVPTGMKLGTFGIGCVAHVMVLTSIGDEQPAKTETRENKKTRPKNGRVFMSNCCYRQAEGRYFPKIVAVVVLLHDQVLPPSAVCKSKVPPATSLLAVVLIVATMVNRPVDPAAVV